MFFVIAVMFGVFFWYVSKQAAAQPVSIEGKSVLKPNSIFGLSGMVCMTLGLFVPFYSLIMDDFSANGMIVIFVFFIFFFGLGYWAFSWYRSHCVIYDDNQITVISSKTKQRTFQWTDIKDVRLNAWSGKYIVTLKSDETIGIYQYLTGVEDFIKRVRNTS